MKKAPTFSPLNKGLKEQIQQHLTEHGGFLAQGALMHLLATSYQSTEDATDLIKTLNAMVLAGELREMKLKHRETGRYSQVYYFTPDMTLYVTDNAPVTT